MKPESKRLAIAEHLGWKRVNSDPESCWGANADKNKQWVYVHQLPDFTNDLNAMKLAEDSLDLAQFEMFEMNLGDIVGFGIGSLSRQRAKISATAEQRVEAFLRTVGKWVE